MLQHLHPALARLVLAHILMGFHPPFQPPVPVGGMGLLDQNLGQGPNQPAQRVGGLPFGGLGDGPNQPAQQVGGGGLPIGGLGSGPNQPAQHVPASSVVMPPQFRPGGVLASRPGGIL